MSLLVAERVSRRFGGLLALDSFDLEVGLGEIHGLIGPNGAGKSTFVALASGEISPTSGRIVFGNRDVTRADAARRARLGVARTFQNLRLFRRLTVLENVLLAAHTATARGDIGIDRDPRAVAQASLKRAGVPSEDWSRVAGDLPYMPQRLVEIARAIATHPRLILLDEPAAGANEDERAALTNVIKDLNASGMSILLIEHDVEFVFRLAHRISVLDQGALIAVGPPGDIRRDPAVIDAYLGAELA